MNIDILTLFPDMFRDVLGSSILGRAQSSGTLTFRLVDIRDFSDNKHNKADDYPFGGGHGMVMLPQPAFDALEHVGAREKRVLYMSPRGRILDQELIEDLADEEELVILCGHYEGIDQRIIDEWNMEEVSIGDYILTGGELPAMVLIDSVARMLPGVLGKSESATDESIYSGLLEYPQYTQPRNFRGLEVPEVLTSGDHRRIYLWKLRNSLIITAERRPDLFDEYIRRYREDPKKYKKDERKIIEEIISMY